MTELWGGETRKAIDNFPVSGRPIPVGVVRWLGRIKAAAARVNAELGLLDAELAERIAAAGDAIAAGEHDDQFPIDVFQTGSGTSSNMNANEVIANLAGEGAHPNDHVNMGQSSNDVFPSAVHLAALDAATQRPAARARASCEASLARQGRGVRRRRQGRPHAPDGRRPGHARPGVRRLRGADPARRATASQDALPRRRRRSRSAAPRPAPGLNTHPEFAARVRAQLAEPTPACRSPRRSTRSRRRRNRDALVELSGALKVVAVSLTKIANDLALMGSGPRTGLGELFLPELQKGSSIMPGKVNPVIPRGRAPGRGAGDRQRHRDHDRRHAGQLRAERPHPADRAQPARVDRAARRGEHAARREVRRRHRGERRAQRARTASRRRRSPRRSTRTSATTARPRSSRRRPSSGRTLREVAREQGVDESVLDEALDLRAMARGNQAG